jgi:hypothetical protein
MPISNTIVFFINFFFHLNKCTRIELFRQKRIRHTSTPPAESAKPMPVPVMLGCSELLAGGGFTAGGLVDVVHNKIINVIKFITEYHLRT